MRELGRSGLSVSALGLGCMGMSDFYGAGDEAELIATIHRAIVLIEGETAPGRWVREGRLVDGMPIMGIPMSGDRFSSTQSVLGVRFLRTFQVSGAQPREPRLPLTIRPIKVASPSQ